MSVHKSIILNSKTALKYKQHNSIRSGILSFQQQNIKKPQCILTHMPQVNLRKSKYNIFKHAKTNHSQLRCVCTCGYKNNIKKIKQMIYRHNLKCIFISKQRKEEHRSTFTNAGNSYFLMWVAGLCLHRFLLSFTSYLYIYYNSNRKQPPKAQVLGLDFPMQQCSEVGPTQVSGA